MSSGFSTESRKVGIGDPRSPVDSRVATSRGVGPPRKVHGFVRLAGRMGLPQSSFRSEPGAGSPRPFWPWHLLHSMASNISWPRLIEAAFDFTSGGILAASILASLKAGPNVLT